MFLLECLTIFVLVLILQHGEITLITALGNVMFRHGLAHGTSWLMGMGTVGETTVLGELEDLTEITRQLFLLDIKGAEALDSRRVDEPAPTGKGQHLGEGRGMHARVVSITDLRGTQMGLRDELVDERALPHSTVSAEEMVS